MQRAATAAKPSGTVPYNTTAPPGSGEGEEIPKNSRTLGLITCVGGRAELAESLDVFLAMAVRCRILLQNIVELKHLTFRKLLIPTRHGQGSPTCQ